MNSFIEFEEPTDIGIVALFGTEESEKQGVIGKQLLFSAVDQRGNYTIGFLSEGEIEGTDTILGEHQYLAILPISLLGTNPMIRINNFKGRIEATGKGFTGDLILLSNEEEAEEYEE